MRKLSEYAPEIPTGEYTRMRDIAGKPLVLTGVRFGDSQFGEYVLIMAEDDNDNEYTIISSGKYILELMHMAQEQNLFPCETTFTKKGISWYVE